MGIEPTYPAWKAGVLPLNYTRERMLYYHINLKKCKGKLKNQCKNIGGMPGWERKAGREEGPYCCDYLKCPVRISTNSPVVGLLNRGQGEIACRRFLFPLSQQTVMTVRRSRSTLPALVWQISAILGYSNLLMPSR